MNKNIDNIKKYINIIFILILLYIIIKIQISNNKYYEKNKKKNFFLLNGSEDHCLGKIDNNIIIATGFCDGNWKCCEMVKKEYFNKMITDNKRGFIKNIYSYNIDSDEIKIIGELPNYFIPRQESGSIVIKDNFYIFGGYSYKELTNEELKFYKKNNILLPSKKNILTYSDSIIINFKNNNLNIKKSVNLPYPICGFKVVKYKNKIYFFGGSIYTGKSFNTTIKFNNIKIGCSFFSMNLDNNGNIIENSIEFINNFEGTDRMEANIHVYGDYLYVIGGFKTSKDLSKKKGYSEFKTNNVMDNWKYNFICKKWVKISNKKFPIINQGSILYKDYIILIGGTSYKNSYYCNKLNNNFNEFPNLKYRISDLKIETNMENVEEYYFSNLILIYDLIKDKYYLSNYKLPININLPGVTLVNDYIYLLGGEANPILINDIYYGNCTSFSKKMNIKEILKNKNKNKYEYSQKYLKSNIIPDLDEKNKKGEYKHACKIEFPKNRNKQIECMVSQKSDIDMNMIHLKSKINFVRKMKNVLYKK